MIRSAFSSGLTRQGTGSDAVAAVTAALADHGIARIPGFPADPDRFLGFLSGFGEPLHYYGDGTGTHPSSGAIWRIKYDPEQAARCEGHAVDGPLAPHSSQSLREPRPPYFAMLMVDCGWRDGAAGQNGESLFVRWAEAFEWMQALAPGHYPAVLGALRSGVPHPDGTVRSVVYPLASGRGEFDVGVRLKSDLLEYLRAHAPSHPALPAVALLSTAAKEVARCVPLDSGDLVLLDNDRFGHGRESVVGQRPGPGPGPEFNPRELWSVTLG